MDIIIQIEHYKLLERKSDNKINLKINDEKRKLNRLLF